MIRWYSPKDKEGIATLNKNCITLNALASVPFEYAYRVQIGVDDNGDIVVEAISKDRAETGVYDEYNLIKPQLAKTFTRISSRDLMKSLSEMTGIELNEEGKKYPTSWDEPNSRLIIKCGGKK